MPDTAATLGHNLPPDPLEILRQNLAEKHRDLIARGAELAAMQGRLPAACDSDEIEAKLINAIKQAGAYAGTSGACEAARKLAKAPHVEAGAAVDMFFKQLAAPVEAQHRRMNEMLTAYQKRKADAERQRREDEARAAREAARKAAEAMTTDQALDEAIAREAEAQAAQRAAQAKPAELSRTKTDFGVTSSLRTVWKFEVTNAAAVPRAYLAVNDAAIRAAVKAAVSDDGKRCDLEIAGVRIFSESQSVVR